MDQSEYIDESTPDDKRRSGRKRCRHHQRHHCHSPKKNICCNSSDTFGPFGAFGVFGPFGAFGPCGPCCPRTPTGPAASGAILTFVSGAPFTITTTAGGEIGTAALIGFGNSVGGVSLTGGVIDLTSTGTGPLLNFAVSLPRNGTITSLSAYFSSALGLNIDGSVITITAQLYSSTVPNNIFTPIPGALVTLTPPLSGTPPVGTISNGITTGLNIPVTEQTRLLLAFTANVTTGLEAEVVVGYGSGSVAIT